MTGVAVIDAPLRETLEQFRDFINRAVPGSAALYELILDQGYEFRSALWTSWRGRGYRRGPTGECFRNAERLAGRFPDLTYVEGFATTGVLPVHHAWCVEPENQLVVDPTWREDGRSIESWEYLGIPLETEWVEEVTARRGRYSVFGDGPVEIPRRALRRLS